VYLSENPTTSHLGKASRCIRKFCKGAEELFGEEACTFNMHIFSHVPSNCDMWGGLWDSSTFPYEGYNGLLMKLFSGTVYQTEQVMRNHERYKNLQALELKNEDASVLLATLLQRSVSNKRAKTISGVTLLDVGVSRTLSQEDQELLSREFNKIIQKDCFAHLRFIVNNILCHAEQYSRLQRRKNCAFLTSDNRIVEIQCLLRVSSHHGEHLVAQCHLLKPTNRIFCKDSEIRISNLDVLNEVVKTDSAIFVKCEKLKRKCAYFQVQDKWFTSELVNVFERD
jgi:hypothetical protein